MNMKEEHRKILDEKVQDIILRTMHLSDVMAVCKEILRRNKITLKIERRQAEYSKMEDEHIAGFFYAKENGGHENDKNDVIVMRAGLKLQMQEETIAHELGHVILGHTVDGDKENKEANCFARNLLCPIPVITEMSLHTEVEYVKAFNVSERMARCAIKHKDSDYYYITRDRYITYNSKLPYENTITTTTFSDISYQTACTTSLPGLCPVTRVFPYPIPF